MSRPPGCLHSGSAFSFMPDAPGSARSMSSRFLPACVAAFDMPVRQVFIGELVGEADLANAVALNSTLFNAARMLGPAAAGSAWIAAVGTGAGVSPQRGVLYRGPCGAGAAARRGAAQAAPRGEAPWQSRVGVPSSRGGPISRSSFSCCLSSACSGSIFRSSISTMSVSVFHSARARSESDVDDGDRLGCRRTAGGAARAAGYRRAAR